MAGSGITVKIEQIPQHATIKNVDRINQGAQS